MGLKAQLAKPFAKLATRRVERALGNPVATQRRVLEMLLREARTTRFGTDHRFAQLETHGDFAEAVPVRDYEGLRPYVDRAVEGELNVLWPGRPLYFCKTSGTTSGAKYIPLTKASMPNHIGSARNALLAYIAETGNADFVNGKMIFLQGSPKMDALDSGIPFGRLSGIVANHVPGYLQKNRMPSYDTNCIEDWETKLEHIITETVQEDMTLISGIPSWAQMYFERILERTGKSSIREVFPNFNLFVYGGVNFEPYRQRMEQLVGKRLPSIELYPASEGFIAYQNSQEDDGLLLVIDSGIFYEFIPADKYFDETPPRLTLDEVELGVNYAVVLNTNAGLWGYSIGDTVRFTSLEPPKIRVTGRIKHFTSAFGEHVIAEEVERAVQVAAPMGFLPTEFHVAPEVTPAEGLPYHEWFVELERAPESLERVADAIDASMQEQNPYYRDLISGSVLKRLVITPVKPGTFNAYMKHVGRLGGQNKPPRLANDRSVASFLEQHKH